MTGYPKPDQLYTFNKTPGEVRVQLTDQLPDYLIDFSDQPGLRLFKNRLRVVDFTMKHRSVRQIQDEKDPEAQQELFHHLADQLLGFFDIAPLQPLLWNHPNQAEFQKRHLPESFLSGYLAFHLDRPERVEKGHEERVIKLLSILAFPSVLIGDQETIELGNRINQAVGCSVFNAAGVLSEEARLCVVAGAELLVSFDRSFARQAQLVNKPCVLLSLSELRDDSVEEIARSVKNKLDQKK